MLRMSYFVAAVLIALCADAQTGVSFDSTLQKAQSIQPDTARLRQLQNLKNFPGLSPRQSVKLGNLILSAATAAHADSAAMRAYGFLAGSYQDLNDFPAALKNFFNELTIAQGLNDFERQARVFIGISWIYKTTGEIYTAPGDIDKSTQYLLQSLDISRKHQLIELESSALDNLAINYDIKKMHGKAIETFKEALAKIAGLGNPGDKVSILLNMGISYKNSKEYNNSLEAYNSAEHIADSLSSDLYKVYIQDNIAILYSEMQQLPLSEKTALGVIQLSYKIPGGLDAIRLDMYRLLKSVYEKEGRYKDALAYSTMLAGTKDSIFDKDKSAQLKDMQEKYDTDNKDKQIVTQQVQIDYNKKLNILLGAGGIAALLIAGFIYYNLRKTAMLNKTISSQRDALARQSEKLSVMMKELHHRVKNNLQIVSSLLNLQSMRLVDEGAISAVQESKQRVQAMSLIHQRLYKTDDITRINMKEYIKELADFLATSYGFWEDNFTLDLDVAEDWLDIDKALPLGLILNELLTNAFKYAFTGVEHPGLHIAFKQTDGNFTLVVKDNGKGIQPGVWNDRSNTSFGRQLVKALCSQLRAKEDLEVMNGTSFTYTIPAAA